MTKRPTSPRSSRYSALFEPQKRELESRRHRVRRVDDAVPKLDANVRKGVTSTNTTEDMNVFTGANLNVGYAGATVGAGVSGQWGTVKKSGTESANVTNSDASREAREGSSHTASLSQLYHLSFYHLGTNRAIFFCSRGRIPCSRRISSRSSTGPRRLRECRSSFWS